jgi:hypothetical protein
MAQAAGSTLAQIRAFAAKHLGAFQASVADSSSSQSVLFDLSWPVHTSLVVDELWQDAWILRPNASAPNDKVRIVKAYAPSTGALTPDLPWTNAPVQGEAYELHAVIEPLTMFTDLVNAGLKRCMVEVEVVATPIALSTEHSLLGIAPWCEDRSWVRQVGYLTATDDRNKIDPFMRLVRGEVREDHKSLVLNHYPQAFQATDALYIKLMKKAYDDCTTASGIYGSQSGLVADSDHAPGNLDWLGWATVVEAWESYSHLLETAARSRLIPDRLEAAAKFTVANRINCKWPQMTFRPLMQGGPRQGRMVGAYRASTA